MLFVLYLLLSISITFKFQLTVIFTSFKSEMSNNIYNSWVQTTKKDGALESCSLPRCRNTNNITKSMSIRWCFFYTNTNVNWKFDDFGTKTTHTSTKPTVHVCDSVLLRLHPRFTFCYQVDKFICQAQMNLHGTHIIVV